MITKPQVLNDDERALGWLRRRLEWEQILGELRDAGRDGRTESSTRREESAAA